MGKPFLYRCPTTGMNIQGWVDDDESAAGVGKYEPMTCLACGRVHLVNPATGKLLTDDKD